MKNYKTIALASFAIFIPLFSFSTSTANANTSADIRIEQRINTRNEIKGDIKEVQEEVKNMRQDLKVTIAGQKGTQAQQRKTLWTELKRKQVQLVSSRIIKELEIRYNIILKLKSKIADRLTAKSAEYNTASASAKLALFSDAQYQSDLASLKVKMAAITTSDTPKDLLPGIREAANLVRKDLRDLHLFLVEVMKLVATSPKK